MTKTPYSISDKIKYHFNNPKFGWFLILIALLIIVAPFGDLFHGGRHVLELVYGLLLLLGPFFVATNIRRWMLLTLIGVIVFIAFWMNSTSGFMQILSPLLSTAFFMIAFGEILRYVWLEKEINFNTILATICGYLIFAIAAAPLCFFLEQIIPGSFHLPQEHIFFDYIYFSFVSVTTLGYGDIVPVHPLAKAIAIFLSVAGQLYLTVVLGLIIGQFLSSRGTNKTSLRSFLEGKRKRRY